MLWFNRKEKERRMNMISAIKPTSKASLKMQCMIISRGDVSEAEKLYDFFAKDMTDLPDYDPIQPTVMQNVKDNALGMYQFLKENKDDIAQGIDFIRSILMRNGGAVASEPIEALPPINNE